MNKEQFKNSDYKAEIKNMVTSLESLRKDKDYPLDISMGEYVQRRWGVSMDSFYDDLGINPSIDTIENVLTLPDEDVRWLIPEIIRDTLRLGLRRAPIYPNVIAAEQTIPGLSATIPHLNMSDATPKEVNEAETIPTGDISFGDKSIKIGKIGRGIRISYEVRQFVSLNVMAIFLQDFGIKLGHGLDTLLIDILINGEQADGSESAPVVGVAAIGNLVYRDLLRIWVRLARIGRTADSIIGGEDTAIDTLDLPEFKDRKQGSTDKDLDLKTPVPNRTNYFIHGAIPDNQQIVIDSGAAIIKYNAVPLLIERDKEISNQTLEVYASLTTGFAILYRDGRVIVDDSLDFAVNGFPAYMDVDTHEKVYFDYENE